MNDILNPDDLAHHRTASSLDYKDWDFSDVSAWLEEHLKIPQYKDNFCKNIIFNDLYDPFIQISNFIDETIYSYRLL